MLNDSLRILKKYPNRRIYDTGVNAYITLDDVKQLVLERVDFKVVDSRTKKDITQNTLLQIIAESEAGSSPIFTQAMLQDFIRFYEENSQGFFSQYLAQAMQAFESQKELFKKKWPADLMTDMLKFQQKMWGGEQTASTKQKSRSKK